MRTIKLFLALAGLVAAVWSTTAIAADTAPESGVYLRWNVDHTEREPRPVYRLDAEDSAVLGSYRLRYDAGRLVSVRFFHGGDASPHGDYGAHELVRLWDGGALREQYRNAAGERITNARGVWETRYDGNDSGFWAMRRTFGPDGALLDVGGYAELRVRRDDEGRRVFETRHTAAGEQVPEHNGFLSASFGFDRNDFATYRRYELPDGSLKDGTNGFAEVRFGFDEQGNFLREEVYDALGRRANFPAGYARILHSGHDRLGRAHTLELRTSTNAPFGRMPLVQRTYNRFGTRAGQRYFLLDGTPGHDSRGAHEVRYHYDVHGARTHITRYDTKGQEIVEE